MVKVAAKELIIEVIDEMVKEQAKEVRISSEIHKLQKDIKTTIINFYVYHLYNIKYYPNLFFTPDDGKCKRTVQLISVYM